MPESDSAHVVHAQSTPILSLPSLAAALRETDSSLLDASSSTSFAAKPLVPMYKIGHGSVTGSVAEEAAAAATVVTNISERLRRMGAAYGEWDTFDGPAYFDLLLEQYEWLVKLVEQAHTVNVVFFVDLLLPSFRSAELFWREQFYPAYQAVHSADARLAKNGSDSAAFTHFFETVQPEMVTQWTRLVEVAQQARTLLVDDIGYLATNGSQEERLRHRSSWQRSAAANLDSSIEPALQSIPTLTLSFEFMLPAHRQPERLQRLRRNRALARRSEQRANGE